MPLATTLPAAILDTILIHLATLFLAGAAGNPIAARQAAAHMLRIYNPRNEEELRLAANIVGFSFHALEALGQAAAPDLPITRVLRLRGSAVSLSREANKAERRLTQLRNAPQQAIPAEAAPKVEKTIAPIEAVAPIEAAAPIEHTAKITIAPKVNAQAWNQAEEDRQRDIRIAAGMKRMEARIAAKANAAIPNPGDHAQSMAHAI
jgi:hypothetical protein